MATLLPYGVDTSTGQLKPVDGADTLIDIGAISRTSAGAVALWADAAITSITIGGGASNTSLTLMGGSSPGTISIGNAASGAITVAGGAFSLDCNGSMSLDATGTAANFTLTSNDAGTTTMAIGITNAGAGVGNMTISADGSMTLNSSGGALGIGTDNDAQAINIGTGASARTITIGNGTGGTSLVLNCGTGALNIGTNGIARTVSIGNSTGNSALNLDCGTSPLSIGTGAVSHTITIGNSTGATPVVLNAGTSGVNIGTNAIAHPITIGNSTGATSIDINCGTGALNIGTNTIAHAITIGHGTGSTPVTINTGTGNLNLGTNAVAHTVAIGNSTGATAVTVTSGSGGMTLTSTGAALTLSTATSGNVAINPASAAITTTATSLTAAGALTVKATGGIGVIVGDAGAGSGQGSAPQLVSMSTTQRGYLTPANGMLLYNNTTAELNGYINSTWRPIASSEIDTQVFGFTDPTQTSISFNDTTYQFTLTDAGSGWSYYRSGIKHTISGNKTVTLPGTPPTAGKYFIYIDATDGTLSQSTTPWNPGTDTKVLVALVIWNNANTPKYWTGDERHSSRLLRREHYYLHSTRGTQYVSGGLPSGYTVAPGAPTDGANTFGISATEILDEDIYFLHSALADPSGAANAYVIYYRAGGSWTWAYSEVPFRYTAASYIEWDNAGTMTTGQASKYYNSYLLYTNLAGDARFSIVPGRGEYSSLAAAQAEDAGSFDWSGFGILENIIAYQFTWSTSNSYSTKGKCRLEATPVRLKISSTSSTGVVAGSHNSLTGIQGGTSGEYYHLTAAEYAALTASKQFMSLGIFENPTSTDISMDSSYDGTDFQVYDKVVSNQASGRADIYYEGRLDTSQTAIKSIKIPVKGSTVGAACQWAIDVRMDGAAGSNQYTGTYATQGNVPSASRTLVTIADTDLNVSIPTGEQRVVVKIEAYLDTGEILYIGRPFATFE